MAKPPKKVTAGIAAGAIAVGGVGGARLISKGGDDAVRNLDNVGGVVDPVTPPGGGIINGAGGIGGARYSSDDVARQILCDELSALIDPNSPGTITCEELLGSVFSIAGKRFTGVNPTAVEDAADSLLVAQGIYGDLGPGPMRAYLRGCPLY